LAFLQKIFNEDTELIAYLKRAVGYTLTGSTQEQVYFFLHGSGANGKSVFLAVLRALLGEYAKQASFDTFLVQRDSKVRNDLAALAGARLITASEAEEGAKMSMPVIKSWTGADPITARFLFGEDFTFKPVGKIWMAANTKPIISERNFAAWRRVHLIPFLVTIPKAEQDKELEAKLLQELPGILNWALEGLQEYHRIGLEAPKAVKAATETYRRENDSLEAFIAEACQIQRLAVCKNSTLFSEYERFCYENGLKAVSQTKFSNELKSKSGIESKRTMDGYVWMGIGLKIIDEPKQNQTLHTASEEANNGVNMKGMNPNPQSSPCLASQGGDTEMPSYPSSNTPKATPLVANEGFENESNLTPILKAKVWEEVAWTLRHEARRDGQKIGVTSSDISGRSKVSIKDIEQLLKANGWQVENAGVSGIAIWWAPEKALKAMGVS
jgi:P4 family phage/plasmid primase-like protien